MESAYKISEKCISLTFSLCVYIFSIFSALCSTLVFFFYYVDISQLDRLLNCQFYF